ncbi:MAG: hypothetical protein IKF47_03145 [Bacilli bacterium]|nr:hypothetical protein [Bacilli bacterium]
MFPNQSTSILSLLKNIKWGAILDGTSKTLGVINQAIPVIYQVKPIINNAKTMFNIAKIMNTQEEEAPQKQQTTIQQNTTNSPIFYI